jgi:hypothetical protein
MLYILICALLQSRLEENIFNSMVENAVNLKHPNFLVNLISICYSNAKKKLNVSGVCCDFVNSVPSFLSSCFFLYPSPY